MQANKQRLFWGKCLWRVFEVVAHHWMILLIIGAVLSIALRLISLVFEGPNGGQALGFTRSALLALEQIQLGIPRKTPAASGWWSFALISVRSGTSGFCTGIGIWCVMHVTNPEGSGRIPYPTWKALGAFTIFPVIVFFKSIGVLIPLIAGFVGWFVFVDLFEDNYAAIATTVIGFGLLCMAGFLWVVAAWAAASPAVLVEQKGLSAFRRSAQLTRGHRWPIALYLICGFVCVHGPIFAGVYALWVWQDAIGPLLTSSLAAILDATLLGFWVVPIAVLYQRLRSIEERSTPTYSA